MKRLTETDDSSSSVRILPREVPSFLFDFASLLLHLFRVLLDFLLCLVSELFCVLLSLFPLFTSNLLTLLIFLLCDFLSFVKLLFGRLLSLVKLLLGSLDPLIYLLLCLVFSLLYLLLCLLSILFNVRGTRLGLFGSFRFDDFYFLLEFLLSLRLETCLLSRGVSFFLVSTCTSEIIFDVRIVRVSDSLSKFFSFFPVDNYLTE